MRRMDGWHDLEKRMLFSAPIREAQSIRLVDRACTATYHGGLIYAAIQQRENFMRNHRSMFSLSSYCPHCAPIWCSVGSLWRAQGLTSSELSRLRSVGSVELSPDGRRIAYTVTMRDRPGRPYGQLWIMDVPRRNRSASAAKKIPAAVRCGRRKQMVCVSGQPGWRSTGCSWPDRPVLMSISRLAERTNSPLRDR